MPATDANRLLFATGDTVAIHGMKHATSLNGRLCVVTKDVPYPRSQGVEAEDATAVGVEAVTVRAPITLIRNWSFDRPQGKIRNPNDTFALFSVKRENLKPTKVQTDCFSSSKCQGCRDVFDGPEYLQRCAQCKVVFYCSKACQRKDWVYGHQNDCAKLRSERKLNRGDAPTPEKKKTCALGERRFVLTGMRQWTESERADFMADCECALNRQGALQHAAAAAGKAAGTDVAAGMEQPKRGDTTTPAEKICALL
jgi:hypothetical protein